MKRTEEFNIVGINFSVTASESGYISVKQEVDKKELVRVYNLPGSRETRIKIKKQEAIFELRCEKYKEIFQELDELTTQQLKSLHPEMYVGYEHHGGGEHRKELRIQIPNFAEAGTTSFLRRIGLVKTQTPEQRRENLQTEAFDIIYSALKDIAERENGELREKFLAKVQEIEARPIDTESEHEPVLRASQAIKAGPAGSFEERTARDPREILRKELAAIFGVDPSDRRIDEALKKIHTYIDAYRVR